MIFLMMLLLALPVPPCRGDGHNAHRSQAALRAFRHSHPCPGGPDRGSTRRCRGYVIDHTCPLECCGADDPGNMQYQTIEEAKKKDRWEGNCARSCRR